jgi:uncharacterized protein YdaU (DUF1376 family)
VSNPRNGLFVEYCAKDFLDGTQMLDVWEEIAYRRVIDMIYATNDRLADDDRKLAWMTKVGSRWKTIKSKLVESGKIEVLDGRITNARCRKELEKSARKIDQQRGAGLASSATGKSLKNLKPFRTAVRTDDRTDDRTNYLTTELIEESKKESDANASPKTDEPTGAKTDERRSTGTRGSRLPADWEPDPDCREFAHGLGLDPDETKLEFRDYWIAQPGARGVKVDWCATWRNRCREIAKRPRGVRGQQSYAGRQEPVGVVAALRNLGARSGNG